MNITTPMQISFFVTVKLLYHRCVSQFVDDDCMGFIMSTMQPEL